MLLTAQNNSELLIRQAKALKVKNIIITNKEKFDLLKKQIKLNVYNNFKILNKIFKKK